jgi:hypothetical protein
MEIIVKDKGMIRSKGKGTGICKKCLRRIPLQHSICISCNLKKLEAKGKTDLEFYKKYKGNISNV